MDMKTWNPIKAMGIGEPGEMTLEKAVEKRDQAWGELVLAIFALSMSIAQLKAENQSFRNVIWEHTLKGD